MKCLLFAKVRRLFHRDHLSISEIRRRTSLSRDTIKAWLKEARTDVHQYFDWSDEWLTVGGVHRKIQAAHTKLCASRAFFLSGHPTQTHEMLYDAHPRAFTAPGGVPRRGIYDNMKTAVDKAVKRTNARVVNARVETALKPVEEPLADTARHDRLNDREVSHA